MGRKGASKSLKRLNAPAFWRIHRKEMTFTPKALPGPHPAKESFTLAYVLRDLLGMARNRKEIKQVLHAGKVIVDGKVRKEPRHPVGLMDVVHIPDMKKTYRLLPSKLYNLRLVEITKDTGVKLCKIMGKRSLAGGKVQLNLHDGRNVVVEANDTYRVHDVVKIDLKSKEIKDHVSFAVGKLAIVHSGINDGRHGIITSINKVLRNNTVTLDDQGEKFDTALDYVFVVGDTKASIEIPE